METIRSIEPVARKEHRCMFCGGVIQRGEQYSRSTIVDGDIYDWVAHKNCMGLTWMMDMDEYNEGLYPDEFKCAIQDYVVEHHPDWDHMDIAGCAKRIYDELNGDKKLQEIRDLLKEVSDRMEQTIDKYKIKEEK